MPHTGFGNDVVSEFAHMIYGAFEHDRLETLLVIQVGMHGGHRQIMMRMLNTGQSLGKTAFVMIVDVG